MRLLSALVFGLLIATGHPGSIAAQEVTLQSVLQTDPRSVERPSRRTVGEFIEGLLASGAPGATDFLVRWRDREVWLREDDGLFFYGPNGRGDIDLVDIDTGAVVGTFSSRDLKQIRPNSGVRGVINAALVQFQLSDPDPAKRAEALDAIERDGEASQLEPLRASIEGETDPDLLARKERLERLLTISFGETSEERVAAIQHFDGDIAIDVRAALNPILTTSKQVIEGDGEGVNVARIIEPGSADLSVDDALAMLVDGGDLEPFPSVDERNAALIENLVDGRVGTVDVATLDTQSARDFAYDQLAEANDLPRRLDPQTAETSVLPGFQFAEVYRERDQAVTAAAEAALDTINSRVNAYRTADLALDALSLASIYFLAAIGLAITFGVMGVINMAHGEFIMMGAYTGYVVQQFIEDYTISIIVALPLAFGITFGAGVAMERLVIRHLMHRPLETLLATFGISIALQQLAKNIFGTQARPLTSPGWLDGSLVFNDIVSISYIRIAIFVLAIIFFLVLLYILNRTRLGLEVRAVTQNPSMASSMGINPDKINMLTFGLGSGIAGIAGVAIGLFAQVTSELGANYIVQSFMTVVVGGVGNIFGTLAGAGMIGSLQKVIEFFNPSNTLAAQTYMIIFIIIFIQFRPKGIIALKGRAAGD
ncbi:MAG: urea ABC transporter permease subunit UrtB [Pseudomonadota bacterium]